MEKPIFNPDTDINLENLGDAFRDSSGRYLSTKPFKEYALEKGIDFNTVYALKHNLANGNYVHAIDKEFFMTALADLKLPLARAFTQDDIKAGSFSDKARETVLAKNWGLSSEVEPGKPGPKRGR